MGGARLCTAFVGAVHLGGGGGGSHPSKDECIKAWIEDHSFKKTLRFHVRDATFYPYQHTYGLNFDLRKKPKAQTKMWSGQCINHLQIPSTKRCRYNDPPCRRRWPRPRDMETTCPGQGQLRWGFQDGMSGQWKNDTHLHFDCFGESGRAEMFGPSKSDGGPILPERGVHVFNLAQKRQPFIVVASRVPVAIGCQRGGGGVGLWHPMAPGIPLVGSHGFPGEGGRAPAPGSACPR